MAQARAFLSGKPGAVQQELAAEMEAAAAALEFERAAAMRDRIRALTHVQGTDVINPASLTDADVIAAWQTAGQTCVQVFFIRGGRNNGNRAFFPAHTRGEEPAEVLAAFIAQFYDDKPPPPLLLLNHELPEQALIAEALRLKAEPSAARPGGDRGAAARRETRRGGARRDQRARGAGAPAGRKRRARRSCWTAWPSCSAWPAPPERIEVYDNSHIMGANAYGVMIVAGPEGFVKAAYRKFGIRGPIAPGDDFAMMREVLERRFGRALRENPDQDAPPPDWPDLVLIDGGAGQLSAARGGAGRSGRARREAGGASPRGRTATPGANGSTPTGAPPFQLPPRDPVLYFLQRLRDEAHRFAITTHRAGRVEGAGDQRAGRDRRHRRRPASGRC